MSRTVLFMAAVLLATIPAAAQDVKPVEFQIGGGMTFPNSEVRDVLGDGYNFNFGMTFNVNPVIGIEALYSFNGLGQKRISIPVGATPNAGTIPTDFYGDMNMQFGTVNLVVRKPTGDVRPYLVTGFGIYYRPIKVTSPAVGFVPGYCNPYWYVCSGGGFVPVEEVVGERSSTDFGMDIGAGITFKALFLEARYHYIWGPEIDTTSIGGDYSKKANGQFLPITVGLRF